MMNEDSELPTENLLPIGNILLGSFLIPWQKRWRMLQALAVPMIALITLGIFNSYYYYSGTFSLVLGFLLYYVLFTVLAVTCHRLVLLGDESVPKHGIAGWSLREIKFFGLLTVLTLGYIFINLATVPLAGLLILNLTPLSDQLFFQYVEILWFPALYLFGRLSLVFPATAVGKNPNITWAWQISRGNGLRLLVIIGLIPWVFQQVVMQVFWEAPNFLNVLVFALLFCLLYIVEIVALSLSYRELTELHERKFLLS